MYSIGHNIACLFFLAKAKGQSLGRRRRDISFNYPKLIFQTFTFVYEHLLKTGCQPGLVAANMTSPLSRANILNNQDYLFARRLFKTALLPRNYKRLSTHEFLVLTQAIWIKLARLKHWQNCIFRHKYLFALPLNSPLICFN